MSCKTSEWLGPGYYIIHLRHECGLDPAYCGALADSEHGFDIMWCDTPEEYEWVAGYYADKLRDMYPDDPDVWVTYKGVGA